MKQRFLGLPGIICLAIVAGVIYMFVNYRNPSNVKMDKDSLNQIAADAMTAAGSTGVEAQPVQAQQPTSGTHAQAAPEANDPALEQKLRQQENLTQKAIDKFAQRPTKLPKAKSHAHKNAEAAKLKKSADPSDSDVAEELSATTPTEPETADEVQVSNDNDSPGKNPEDMAITSVTAKETKDGVQKEDAPEVETKKTAVAPTGDQQQIAALKEELRDAKTMADKQALLGKLKAINAAADERARMADQLQKQQQDKPTTKVPALTADTKVRQVEELKQMPGNPVPQYDADDSSNGRHGTVVYRAYVDNAGKPQQFEMVQTSGYRNLDFKSLKALKQWKFAAGQEGWVEIPIHWDIKGSGEQPSALNSKVSDTTK
jgi:TonB family protein